MLFRQLLEPDSSTYTYVLSCPQSGATALIDPVLDTVDRDLRLLQEMGLKLTYTIDTHVHADHLTGAQRLKSLTGSSIVYPAMDALPCADIGIREGEAFRIGTIELHPLFTPGHTNHHHGYMVDTDTHRMLFTGDALLIGGCGRTDFQSGDTATLYKSIHEKYFSQPDDTLVYPAHDYNHRHVSTVAQEKARNEHIGGGKSLDEFIEIMDNLDLPYPRKIDFAVPGNEQCGQCPDNVPDKYKGPCERHDQGR